MRRASRAVRWRAGYAARERGQECPWGDDEARAGWEQAKQDEGRTAEEESF